MRLPLLALIPIAACGGGDAAPAPDAGLPRDTVIESRTLAPGEIIEGRMHGTPSDLAVIRATASFAALDWNIHGHAGDETQTVYEELDVVSFDYEFVPGAEADWWLLLRNGGGATLGLDLEVELYGGMTWAWE